MNMQFTFGEQLAFSEGVATDNNVEKILLDSIPGALKVTRASSALDRRGTDYWVEHLRGDHLSVDLKTRKDDFAAKYGQDDLAIETWSVVGKSIIGWSRDKSKRTDYVLWLWQDTGRWCLVPFPMLCAVTEENWRKWQLRYGPKRQTTNCRDGSSYQSECVFVPRRELWAQIYRKFSGRPEAPAIAAEAV